MLETAVFLSGIGQIVLVLGSAAIPQVLRWKEQLTSVRPLIRQVFWTYAGYILVSNLSFGLVSAFMPEALLDHSRLAAVVTGFMAVWWTGRIGIQFFYFDRSDAPGGWITRVGETALVGLFAWLSVVYGLCLWHNLH